MNGWNMPPTARKKWNCTCLHLFINRDQKRSGKKHSIKRILVQKVPFFYAIPMLGAKVFAFPTVWNTLMALDQVVIIINNGSAIAKEYDPWIAFIKHTCDHLLPTGTQQVSYSAPTIIMMIEITEINFSSSLVNFIKFNCKPQYCIRTIQHFWSKCMTTRTQTLTYINAHTHTL